MGSVATEGLILTPNQKNVEHETDCVEALEEPHIEEQVQVLTKRGGGVSSYRC